VAIHGVAQALSAGRAGRSQILFGKQAEHRIGAQPGLAEPGAFLGAKGENLHRSRRHNACTLEMDDRGQGGDDAGGAVKIAALRHRIQMRSAGDERLFRFPARQCNDEIFRCVLPDLKTFLTCGMRNQVMSRSLAGRVRFPRDPDTVKRIFPQFLEQRKCESFHGVQACVLFRHAGSHILDPVGSGVRCLLTCPFDPAPPP
jgi:hypothetical protein